MRVVELSTFHEHCGIATYSEALVDALREHGASVEVLAPFLPTGAAPRGEQPKRLWSRNRGSVGEALHTFDEVRRLGADIVQAQVNLGLFSSRFLLVLATACRFAGIPLVATLHGRRGGNRFRDWRLGRLELALGSAELIVHNAGHRAELGRRRARVIAHGIHPPVERELIAAKRALGLDPARPVVAHFGFLHPDKGIDEVMRTVAELRQREVPDLYYWICGGTFPTRESQQHLEQLRRLSRELGIADHVRLTGEFLDEARLVDELAAADWIVLNYRTGNAQGTSGAVRHALMAGRPIAVSSAPVFDDVREAVHTLDQPVARALPRLLADQRHQAEVTERARRYCDANSWSRVAARHLEAFEELVAARPR